MKEARTGTGAGRPRLLILGLDGGTLNLIRPWAEQGELPALAGLLSRVAALRERLYLG